MTFVAGFKCTDGIVLCADRLESDGMTKRHRPKIERIAEDSQRGIAWAVAGTGDVADKFTATFKGALRLGEFNQADIEQAAEATLALIHREYPGYLLQVIVGLWSGPIKQSKTEVAKALIYRGRSDVQCLGVESRYAIAGMDVTLAEFAVCLWFSQVGTCGLGVG